MRCNNKVLHRSCTWLNPSYLNLGKRADWTLPVPYTGRRVLWGNPQGGRVVEIEGSLPTYSHSATDIRSSYVHKLSIGLDKLFRKL